jgi:hypothetical protein
MQFAIIDVNDKTVVPVECPDLVVAQTMVGLKKVDHGVVAPGIGIVVDEFGLYVPPDKQSYFAIFGRLYAGHGVLYAFNKGGESVDLIAIPPVLFMPGAAAVERCIELGTVQRPQISVNGVVTWQWPDPENRKRQ